MNELKVKIAQSLLSGVLVGRKDEVQLLQVDSGLMAMLLCLEQLY